MLILNARNLSVSVDFPLGRITSVLLGEKERICGDSPLFSLCLRDIEGKEYRLSSADACECELFEKGARYTGFLGGDGRRYSLSVDVFAEVVSGEITWKLSAKNLENGFLIEWIDFPTVTLPMLEENNSHGDGGQILFPYNEGALVSNWEKRRDSWFGYEEPVYPSKGSFAVFPNMVQSQFISYHWEDFGIYMGAHDPSRGVKGIDFCEKDGAILIRFRLWCGGDFGAGYEMDFPIVWSSVGNAWQSAAERYRTWFEAHPPKALSRVRDTHNLPAWYEDSPLVITYPVRGLHDTDNMIPNRMYPYINVLPTVGKLKDRVGGRIMVLLMHWEGTAPWAPPFVYPPYGGENELLKLADALHREGDLLGVYCSGFGYTLQSNLVSEYNREEEYRAQNLESGMCASPSDRVEISRICTAQRKGYDICPASDTGRKLLDKAYTPLFESGLDYAQILDQNHGGGQYFCYSRHHGHPPAPGAWMTECMQSMLGEWNEQAKGMLFGCESAAAEPFIGNLRFSDNRYELNYHIGKAVPLYSYIYHEYARNFMGNQVCSPFDETMDESLLYRIAYSFAAGDSMTLVLNQDGCPMSRWGDLKTDHVPDGERILTLVANLSRLYREKAKEYLFDGRMVMPPCFASDTVVLKRKFGDCQGDCILPAVCMTAWEGHDHSRACVLVNPTETERECILDGKRIKIPALDGVLVKLM